MNYKILGDEITNDPAGLGYSGKTDGEIADLLNGETQTVDREAVSANEIIEATVPSEWGAISDAEKQRYRDFIGAGSVNMKGANTRAALDLMFGTSTTTHTNLLALRTMITSRAVIIGFGLVKPGYVAKAMGGA